MCKKHKAEVFLLSLPFFPFVFNWGDGRQPGRLPDHMPDPVRLPTVCSG